jgi:hypothetical protein
MLRKIGIALALVAIFLPWRTTGSAILYYEFSLISLIQYLFQNGNVLLSLLFVMFVVGILLSLKHPMFILIGLPAILYNGYDAIQASRLFQDGPLSLVGYGFYLATISVLFILLSGFLQSKMPVTVTEKQ